MPDDGPRTDRATPARVYDYLLGGENNFAADREAAEQLLRTSPEVGVIARAHRAFLARAVRYLTAAGIRQFIDLGAGLPTSGAVHEVARSVAPDVRVAYVDNDPLVHAHARTLPPQNGIALIDADLRSPRQVLDHPALRALISVMSPQEWRDAPEDAGTTSGYGGVGRKA